jgi:hypothetical protein
MHAATPLTSPPTTTTAAGRARAALQVPGRLNTGLRLHSDLRESPCHAVRCAPRPAAASGERVAFSQVVRDELRCVAKRAVRGGWYQRGHSKGILPVAATI